MRLEDAVFGWTPLRLDRYQSVGSMDVGFIHERRWNSEFARTDGVLFAKWRAASPQEREYYMLQLFHLIVVADGIDPRVAHEAFLKIDEYRWGILPDVPGAEERP